MAAGGGGRVVAVARGPAQVTVLLTVRDGKADCVPTDREPDLSLDIRDLGSVYLGATAPSTLVRAGHIQAHCPGVALLADSLFRADRPPHCLHQSKYDRAARTVVVRNQG